MGHVTEIKCFSAKLFMIFILTDVIPCKIHAKKVHFFCIRPQKLNKKCWIFSFFFLKNPIFAFDRDKYSCGVQTNYIKYITRSLSISFDYLYYGNNDDDNDNDDDKNITGDEDDDSSSVNLLL